ncbi:MAG TPA: helix-turn-helix domain-containing protein [Pyrinomonadaceae bacterium]
MLKVPEVAERLGVLTSTVRIWCRSGRFPNAVQETTLRGPVWLIPESDLVGFEKRGRGRPPKKEKKEAA